MGGIVYTCQLYFDVEKFSGAGVSGGNRDRGPVRFYAIRLHLEY